MTLLQVQYVSHVSTSAGSSGGAAAVLLALVVLSVLAAGVLVLIRDWRRFRAGDAATLVTETERWLRRQYPHW